METITYSQVQELVMRLPATRLPLIYDLLVKLIDKQAEMRPPQRDFMLLSLQERRRIMAQQAELMATHYEETATERQEWQGGDFTDEY